MIAIIAYGLGNLYSIQSSLKFLGLESMVTCNKKEIESASHIILPGVGAFGDAMEKLHKIDLVETIREQAASKKPLLGICLGMQILYDKGFEYGENKGLGLVSGNVVNLDIVIKDEALKIPHMGWNSLDSIRECSLTKYLDPKPYMYYVHSFYADISDDTVAFSKYGTANVTGIVQHKNVFGTQFHPEKSGVAGLSILRAFSEL